MTLLPTYFSTNDYEIHIQDYLTGDYIPLGSGDYCSVTFDGVGSPDLREAVFDVSGGDGIMFGTEYHGAITWTITGSVHSGFSKNVAGSADAVWNSWSQLSRAWSHYPERKIPRAVVPLYFKRPGRDQMVVFGRPNRIDPEVTQSYVGFIKYTATFRQSDPRFYSATSKTVTITADAPITGGLLLTPDQEHLYLPFRTSMGTPQTGSLTNGGDTDTNPLITFTGPVHKPQLVLKNSQGFVVWGIYLDAAIPAGKQVTIDTRPWARSVLDSDGNSWAGAYMGNKLQDLTIPPGTHSAQYLGTDQTASSTCRIEYRNAWASL